MISTSDTSHIEQNTTAATSAQDKSLLTQGSFIQPASTDDQVE